MLVVLSMGGVDWGWWSYWNPFGRYRDVPFADLTAYVALLLVLALPLIATGVGLTLRRLRDAGWPLWLVALFFSPRSISFCSRCFA